MKRFVTFILALILILSLSGCSRSTSNISSIDSDSTGSYSTDPSNTDTNNEADTTETVNSSTPDATSSNTASASASVTGASNSPIPDTASTSGPNTTNISTPKPSATGTAKTSTPGATKTPSPSNQKPASTVKYTDGNSYMLTTDKHFIVKIDPNFKGYEVIYEGNFEETLYQPVYRNGSLFFTGIAFGGSEKIYRLDLSTKKVTTVFSSDKISNYSDWTIIEDKIFIRSIKSGDIVTIWTCNLDGSNLKKTSATDISFLSPPSYYNGKLYLVSYYSSTTPKFYEMNLDGTGFRKIFTQSHKWCIGYSIVAIQNGYIYYGAETVKTKPDSDEGLFKVKLDGTGRKKLMNGSYNAAVAYNDSLYVSISNDTLGLCRIDKNDKIFTNIALKDLYPAYLTNLNNGIILAECDQKDYLLSTSNLKVYESEDFSPPSPFKDYHHGLNIISMPAKTSYKVGEPFDPTGFKAVYYIEFSGILRSPETVEKSITYKTSDGVELTKGRPFTTPGTKVVEIWYNGWKETTFTITVTKDSSDNPDNLKPGLNILSHPSKTSYKVGEGFDTTGFKAVYYADGKTMDVNDKITFFTSKTVELTQGRPFTTTGTKVVEIRYEGKKVSTYNIEVK